MTSDPDGAEPINRTGFEAHDHARCISDAMALAEEHSKKEGLNFTPVRKKTMEILLKEHKALGAYAILEKLREAGFGSQPPVAYRALDFLVSHGFAHKVEKLNAFIACAHPGANHAPLFMICRSCDTVAEGHAPQNSQLTDAARATGFKIEKTVVEAEGLCPNCIDEAKA